MIIAEITKEFDVSIIGRHRWFAGLCCASGNLPINLQLSIVVICTGKGFAVSRYDGSLIMSI
jgi:hypothetical protein